jgi:hypothetical protein
MKNTDHLISRVRRNRLEVQGYKGYTDAELNDYKYGIRLAYYMCGSLVLLGLILTNIYILAASMIIAFFGTILPNHPFDYFYNGITRHLINKPKMIRRRNQGRFACGLATVWLGLTIYLFYTGHSTLGYIAGGILIGNATLVSTADICIPSLIYNFLFLRKEKSMQGPAPSVQSYE